MELKPAHMVILGALYVADDYPDIPVSKWPLTVHLLEVGYISIGSYPNRQGHKVRGYAITDAGRREYERLRNPPDEAAALRADIARLETALADKRAQLAVLEKESEG